MMKPLVTITCVAALVLAASPTVSPGTAAQRTRKSALRSVLAASVARAQAPGGVLLVETRSSMQALRSLLQLAEHKLAALQAITASSARSGS